MKDIIKKIIVCAIVILFAGIYSIVDINTPVYDKKIDNSEYDTCILSAGDTLTQSFVCEENQLDGVEVKIATEGNKQSVQMRYELRDAGNSVLRDGIISLEKQKNGKYFEFRFDTLSDCAGKEYSFSMELTECDEDTEISVYEVPCTAKDVQYTVNKESKEQTLALRTITHRFNLETFVVTIFFSVYVILFMRWLSKLFKG